MIVYHIMIIYEATVCMDNLLFIAQKNLLQSKARAWFMVSHEVAPAWLSSLIYLFYQHIQIPFNTFSVYH